MYGVSLATRPKCFCYSMRAVPGADYLHSLHQAPLPKKDLKMTIQRLVIYYNNSPDGSSSDCEAGTNLCP